MFSGIRTLMLAGGILVLFALFSPDVFAITIMAAEVDGDEAVVAGRKAASNGDIYWEGGYVTKASRNGKFSFQSDNVPDDCVGILFDGVTKIDVELDPCGSGGGEPPPEPDPALTLVSEYPGAHGGSDVRAVGFRFDAGEQVRFVSGGEDSNLHSWILGLPEPSVHQLDHTIYDLESSYDGSIVLTGEGGWNGGTDSNTFRIFDESGFLIGTRAPIGYVYCVALSRDAQWAVASGFYGDIVVYETSGLELYASKSTKKKRTNAFAK